MRRGRVLLATARRFAGAVEPGGPSELFGARGVVPVYPRLAALDTLDYAERTLWSDAPQDVDASLAPVQRRWIAEAAADRGGRPAR
jgi:hypothetical protein